MGKDIKGVCCKIGALLGGSIMMWQADWVVEGRIGRVWLHLEGGGVSAQSKRSTAWCFWLRRMAISRRSFLVPSAAIMVRSPRAEPSRCFVAQP